MVSQMYDWLPPAPLRKRNRTGGHPQQRNDGYATQSLFVSPKDYNTAFSRLVTVKAEIFYRNYIDPITLSCPICDGLPQSHCRLRPDTREESKSREGSNGARGGFFNFSQQLKRTVAQEADYFTFAHFMHPRP